MLSNRNPFKKYRDVFIQQSASKKENAMNLQNFLNWAALDISSIVVVWYQ